MKITVARLVICSLAALLCGGCSTVSYSPIPDNLHVGHYGSKKPAARDSLRVVSYNIAYAEKIDEAIADIRANPRLDGADILLLQEMDTEGTRRMAKELGLNFVYWPAFVHQEHGRTFGNAVLSPWPIVGQDAVVLPHANPLDGHHRLAVAADVQVGTRTVRAVSVHLSTMVVTLSNRLEQAATLVDSLAAGRDIVVFGGDFNTAAQEALIETRRLMRKAGYRQVKLPRGNTVRTSTLKRTRYELVLDHFFYSGVKSESAGIDNDATASDHLPVWAVFAWPDEFMSEEDGL